MNILIENSSFENFPIEFKEISPEDFQFVFKADGTREERNCFEIENNGEKIVISPNENGYINEELQNHINLEHKNTVVINAAVGQGKSHAIIQTIKRYYDITQNGGQQYLIFVASPFVSLVKQYCNDIELAGIPENHIYNYDNLGRNSEINYIERPIQVITANTLLGNPGEDGFKNSETKREYLNHLAYHCERNNIQVVFIYDELHDSFQNFKQEYIFNLWKWKNVIHKNFILSATYNEASKLVIEYLAELTDFKIQIIESARVRFPEKQSSLHLHYFSEYNITSKTPEIKDLVFELISKGKNIDILCYSKTLAKSLLNTRDDIGKLLTNTFGQLKDCTSELITNQRTENEEPKNQFDNSKCNIGTNFKTGVSIKKENPALIIILPPRSTRLWFRNKYGIFSGGINSVIQALARQRNKGEIHIILPKPDKFDYTSLDYSGMNLAQKEEFVNYYNLLNYYKDPEKLVKYIKLNRQDFFLREFYENKLKANVRDEIEIIENNLSRFNLAKLSYPTYDEFKLENGEDFLANEYPIFGEDISAYLTYAALTNQFINCTLKEIRFKPVIIFPEGQIQNILEFVYQNFFGLDHYDSLGRFSNFKLFYSEIRNSLYNDFSLKLKRADNNKWENIAPNTSVAKKFEIQLIHFVYELWSKGGIIHTTDIDYSRSEYFLECISHAKNIDISEIEDGEYKNRIKLYQIINYFREKLINSLYEYQRGSEHYFCTPSNLWNGFFDISDTSRIQEIIVLLESDNILNENIFEFKRRFRDNKTIETKLKTFYSMLVEDFLIVENRERDPYITLYSSRRNCKVINSIKIIPNISNSMDLIENQDYINL